MTSDSGVTSQETDYAKHIQEVLDELRQLQRLLPIGMRDRGVCPSLQS
jgi:hypothetical protein